MKNASIEILSNLVVSSIPDYTRRLDSELIDQLQIMKFMNKVILFTAKEQAPPILKALAAKYRNRLVVRLLYAIYLYSSDTLHKRRRKYCKNTR